MEIHVILRSLGSFICCKGNGNIVTWVISSFNQTFFAPPQQVGVMPKSVCMEMWINKCLSCCPLIWCPGPLSEKPFADKKLKQLAVIALGREVEGRAVFKQQWKFTAGEHGELFNVILKSTGIVKKNLCRQLLLLGSVLQ